MTRGSALIFIATLMAIPGFAKAQTEDMHIPRQIHAGDSVSIPTSGSGNATLYVVGPGQAIKREVTLGSPVAIPSGVLYSAGHYLVVLVHGASRTTGSLYVVAQHQPDSLAFLATPSRLPVNQHDGISGTAYVFDVYRNLIVTPMPIRFQLTDSSGIKQQQTVETSDGVAWTRMNSAGKEGNATFTASVDKVSIRRVIDEVPGEPCALTISAHPNGQYVHLQTSPVVDCSGNPIPDGTIVTFTENAGPTISTVDVPIMKGVAKINMSASNGATFSVASGTMVGNDIRWSGSR